jgi:hypothetical protein
MAKMQSSLVLKKETLIVATHCEWVVYCQTTICDHATISVNVLNLIITAYGRKLLERQWYCKSYIY